MVSSGVFGNLIYTSHTTIDEGIMIKPGLTVLSACLTFALTLPVFAQGAPDAMGGSGMKPHDMSAKMGTPTVDATVEGLNIKVWLISQVQHKEMMKPQPSMMMKHGEQDTSKASATEVQGMKHEGMEMDMATKASMTSGTHHIGVEIADVKSGKAPEKSGVSLLIESPSKKSSTVDLKPAMGHFGSGLALDEKGAYKFTLTVLSAGVSRSTKFDYTVN